MEHGLPFQQSAPAALVPPALSRHTSTIFQPLESSRHLVCYIELEKPSVRLARKSIHCGSRSAFQYILRRTSNQMRLINGVLKQIFISPPRLTSTTGPSSLFLPMKIGSRVPLLDCDYNLHKSNSTYFTDFDVARLHLLTCLVSSGMVKTGAELGKGARVGIILGAVNCNFRREIKPYESFEVWSRILAWDRKWLYTISHFVKKGSVTPKGWTLQPWRKVWQDGSIGKTIEKLTAKDVKALENTAIAETEGKLPNGAISPATTPAHPAIFASAIAKYVFKHKRLTIPPERILRNSNLLPPEPVIATPPPASESWSSSSSNTNDPPPNPDTTLLSIPGASEMVMAASVSPPAHPPTNPSSSTPAIPDSWTWSHIEAERQRGLRLAGHLASLEELNGEFTYDGKLALGEYTDLF